MNGHTIYLSIISAIDLNCFPDCIISGKKGQILCYGAPRVVSIRKPLELEYQVQAELIKARTEVNMTQAELAEKSGVRQSNISRIENGNALPRVGTLEALARAMGKKLKISIV